MNMKRKPIGVASMLALALVSPVNGDMGRSAREDPAILLVMFGTSYPEAQAAYENIKRIYKKEFPGSNIQIAFTSDYIRRKIKDRDGISIDNPLTALSRLNDEGYVNVVVQSLHVIPGEEFHDMADIVENAKGIEGKFGFKNIVVGAPLLMKNGDCRNVSAALALKFDDITAKADRTSQKSPRYADETAIVFMGHGTDHPANRVYSQMARVLAEDHKNVFMGTVEGYPTFDEMLKSLEESKVKNVRLMPFMIVAGDHALNDLAGNESKSWKSMLEKKGFAVEFNLKGMGENDAIADIFVQHTKKALDEFS
jgi:sirohydrochlorin cobaltochelatase